MLNCFVMSSQLHQATPTDQTLKQAISKLGLLEYPKPYKDGSHLINFFPKGIFNMCMYIVCCMQRNVACRNGPEFK